jgi:hypothetical protein
MPERQKYAHLFGANPFANNDAYKAFSLLHWGNQFQRATEIEAPEPMIMLGMMAAFHTDRETLKFRKGDAFLAVGHKSNQLYVIPRKNNSPVDVPKFRSDMRFVGKVSRTDYWASKGGQTEHYYYHDHEPPYPSLYVHKSGVGYLKPASWRGKPSYAVGKEGIVG